MSRRFEGKFAAVTGGASGIGLACVQRLAREGAEVLITDWSKPRGRQSADALCEEGLAVFFCHHDAGDVEGWRRVEDIISAKFGRLDVLVNNAYSGVAASFETATPESLRDGMRVNAEGALLGMQAAARLMTAGGSIVNVSSIAAFYPSKSNLGYATGKMAMIHLTGTAALALGKRTPPIRVNTVAPGAINTPTLHMAIRAFRGLPRDAEVSEGLDSFAGDATLGRVGEPEEVASAICFLASDEASYVTGQCLRVDGGANR